MIEAGGVLWEDPGLGGTPEPWFASTTDFLYLTG
jgi:hypothetical protein